MNEGLLRIAAHGLRGRRRVGVLGARVGEILCPLASQPRVTVVGAGEWSGELLVEAVGWVKDWPAGNCKGETLGRKVDVLVGSLYAQEIAERVVKEKSLEGDVEVVVMWGLEVWDFFGEGRYDMYSR